MRLLQQYSLQLAIILCTVLAPVVHAQASSPPLKPNEKVVTTNDGCGFVIDTSKGKAATDYETARISKLTWGGPCLNGLAMGEGWVFEGEYRYVDLPPYKGWLWYGRRIGMSTVDRPSGPKSFLFTWDGRTVGYNTLSTSNPIWPDEGEVDPGRRSSIGDGITSVLTSHQGCILEKDKFPECKEENKFYIPGVTGYDLRSQKIVFHPCPNPRSTQGCEVLWAEHAGPVIENIKAFIAENQPKVDARKREVTPLIAHWRPSPTAARDDAARHAAIRAEHLVERKQQKEKMAEMKRNTERLRAENAARQVEIDRQNAIAEQQRKEERREARRRDRQESMGVLRSYADTSAAMGNRKPARQLAAVEILAGNTPQEIMGVLRTALTDAAARSPALARKLSTLSWPQDISAQDALALLRPVLMDAAGRNPNVAKKLAILEALTASAPQEAMDILKPMLADAVNRRLMR